MYRCPCCGLKFDEPDQKSYTENLDGENGWYTYTVDVCPYCGEEVWRDDTI